MRNHARGCAKCASGEGHRMSVYDGELPRRAHAAVQFARRDRRPRCAAGLRNYQRLKASIEAICEANYQPLRPDEAAAGVAEETPVIERRRAQRSFGDGLIADEVKDLREGWMNHADRLLDDEAIVTAVYEALGRRHPKSRRRGRLGAPAESRACACSFSSTCATGATRFSSAKCAPTWSIATSPASAGARCLTPRRSVVGGLAVGPETVQAGARTARANGAGRKGLRPAGGCASTPPVVETNVHYPTDLKLLGDGVRVSDADNEEDHRDRRRLSARNSVIAAGASNLRVLDIARAARAKGPSRARSGSRRVYGRLLEFDEPGGRTGETIRPRDRPRA